MPPDNREIPARDPLPWEGASFDALFDGGNYGAVAMGAPADEWRKYASLGLVGRFDEAIRGLKSWDHAEARFYEAVAHWIDGRDREAADLFATIDHPHAAALRDWLSRPRIRVLSQLASGRTGTQDLLSGIAADDRFFVQNISFHAEDLSNRFDLDIMEYYDAATPPDFYICQMVEHHLIPSNLQDLPCPLIGQSADYESLIQAVYPALHLFDEIVTTEPHEWQEMSQLLRVPVSTFPKSYGLPASMMAERSGGRRSVDVVSTGTVLHPFFPEKALLYHQVMRDSDLRAFFLNGFLPHYEEMLAEAKVMFSYIIHRYGVATKCIEALASGCSLVAQRGSQIRLYAGENDGLLFYDVEADDLLPRIRQALASWDEWSRRRSLDAFSTRQQFDLARVASQYFRFLVFRATRPRGQRERAAKFVQKRTVLWKGWLPPPQVGGDVARSRMELLEGLGQSSPQDVRPLLDRVREAVLWYAERQPGPMPTVLEEILATYEGALHAHPDCLVLRFDYVRTAFHFGTPQDVDRALSVLEEVLARDAESWTVSPHEDVFPWDLFNAYFNYRGYTDALMRHLKGLSDERGLLRKLILASLHYYHSFYRPDVGVAAEAVRLDTEFPYYRLRYARLMVEAGVGLEEAFGHLQALIETSMLFVEAAEVLRRCADLHPSMGDRCSSLLAYARHARRRTVFIDKLRFRHLQPPSGQSPRALRQAPARITLQAGGSPPQRTVAMSLARRVVHRVIRAARLALYSSVGRAFGWHVAARLYGDPRGTGLL